MSFKPNSFPAFDVWGNIPLYTPLRARWMGEGANAETCLSFSLFRYSHTCAARAGKHLKMHFSGNCSSYQTIGFCWSHLLNISWIHLFFFTSIAAALCYGFVRASPLLLSSCFASGSPVSCLWNGLSNSPTPKIFVGTMWNNAGQADKYWGSTNVNSHDLLLLYVQALIGIPGVWFLTTGTQRRNLSSEIAPYEWKHF